MEEVAGNIIFKQDEKTQFVPHDQINTIRLQEECDPGYFADTENEPLEYNGNDCISIEIRGNSLVDSSCVSELLVDISESNGNDSISANSTNNSYLLHDSYLPGRNSNNSISMNSTPLNRNSDHDPLPQINLQEYGDPELFVEEYKSKGGIDSNSSISVGLNENTFKSSISTDLRMFDPLETKGNIQQPEIISSVDLLDMNYDTKVHTIDYMKSQIDDPVTCNASIWSPINVQNQSRKNCDDKTKN